MISTGRALNVNTTIACKPDFALRNLTYEIIIKTTRLANFNVFIDVDVFVNGKTASEHGTCMMRGEEDAKRHANSF